MKTVAVGDVLLELFLSTRREVTCHRKVFIVGQEEEGEEEGEG